MTYWLRDVDKEFRPLVVAACAQGWTLSRTRHGHPKLTGPDGHAVTVPGRSRGAGGPGLRRKIATQLRSHGVDV